MPPNTQPTNQQYQQPAPTAPGISSGAPAGQQPNTSSQQPSKTEHKANSTQNSLLISEIRDGMVIMADGSFRAVVACKSINFDLMSSREREGVEYSYQNFLNALYFPIQIFIRSQRVDIGPYIDKLGAVRRNNDNMLLNVLMDDYIDFIDALSQEANIMDKSFFIVIPYFTDGDAAKLVSQGKGFFDKFFGVNKQTVVTKINKETYDKAKDEIRNRIDSVLNGLMQVGVQASPLTTKQLGELYYNVYNPDTAVREPLGDFNTVATTYIRKGANTPVEPAPMQGGQNG